MYCNILVQKQPFIQEHFLDPFQFSVCCSTFSRNYILKTHVALVHEWNKPFECDFCRSSFASKGDLKRHIVSVHEWNKIEGTPILKLAMVKR